jgi:hypothetical protein
MKAMMPMTPASTTTVIDQIADAIQRPMAVIWVPIAPRYRKLAPAALKPLAKPTKAMIANVGLVGGHLGDQQPQRLPEGGPRR